MSTTTWIGLSLAALLGAAGCSLEGPTADPPAQSVGPVIARYALSQQDSTTLPCCAVDSGNVRITIVGGSLTFHAPANYRDTVFTPAGPASRACVHSVPNGSFVNTLTHVVTLPDSTSYWQLPCDRGSYKIVVIRELERASASVTDSVTISVGDFTAQPNTVDLAQDVHASVRGAILYISGPKHLYRFDPVR